MGDEKKEYVAGTANFPGYYRAGVGVLRSTARRLAVGAHRSAPVEGGGGVGEPRQRVRRKR